MTDIISSKKRSEMMSGIKAKNTKPEILIRKALFAQGLRFRLHRRDLPGRPDIVFPRQKVAVFVHGCFWHQHPRCKFATKPASNTDFWSKKLKENIVRDEKVNATLLSLGWRVLVIWECVTRDRALMQSVGLQICQWISGLERQGEITTVNTDVQRNPEIV